MYDLSSIVLYLCIVATSTFFATISQSHIIKKETENSVYRTFDLKWYLCSFSVLAFFVCCTGVGIDRESYALFFKITDLFNPYRYFEPGFNLIIGIIKLFTDNEQIFLVIIALMTVALTFKGLWEFRNDISLGWAVFIYSSQYYFQSFNLMRIYLAMSILIYGAKYFKKNQVFKYIIITIIASLIHYSMFFATVACIAGGWLYRGNKVYFYTKYVMVFCVTAIISFFSCDIMVFAINTFSMLSEKYAMYIEFLKTPDIGFKLVFNLMPLILIMLLANIKNNKLYLSFSGGYLLVTLIVSIISYSVPIVGRVLLCLHMPIVIFLPNLIESIDREKYLCGNDLVKIPIFNSKFVISIKAIKICMGVYFIISFILYLYGYMDIDGINNFKFFWNT